MSEITHPMADDTTASVYAEQKKLEEEIRVAAKEVVDKGRRGQVAKNDYEKLKNDEIVHMAFEEISPEFKGKRTDLIRQATYRQKLATERIAYTYAERDYEVAKSYLEALKACLTSVQSRAKSIRHDYD